jgi:hypothetical protein
MVVPDGADGMADLLATALTTGGTGLGLVRDSVRPVGRPPRRTGTDGR